MKLNNFILDVTINYVICADNYNTSFLFTLSNIIGWLVVFRSSVYYYIINTSRQGNYRVMKYLHLHRRMYRIQRLQYMCLQIDRVLKDIRSLPVKKKLI